LQKVDVQLEVLFQNKKEKAYQWKQITNQILVFEALNVYEGFCFSTRKKEIQSNLSTTATLGTPKKRPLFRGWPLFRVWSKILGKVIVGLVGQGIWAGRC
jgi:hypothetical protein